MDEVKPAIDDCGDIRAVPAAVDAIVRDKDEVYDSSPQTSSVSLEPVVLGTVVLAPVGLATILLTSMLLAMYPGTVILIVEMIGTVIVTLPVSGDPVLALGAL